MAVIQPQDLHTCGYKDAMTTPMMLLERPPFECEILDISKGGYCEMSRNS
jgi:hypothetical protein